MPTIAVETCPIDLHKIEILPGQTLVLHNVSWPELERIVVGRGEQARSRLAYFAQRLEFRMPLPEHEKVKRFIVIVIEILLDALELEWEPYGSTTFKRQDRQVGIEPDDCFYVQYASQMLGFRRINLSVDPPPDLAIEVDITSPTRLDAYASLGVPELWRYREGKVEIWQLQDDNNYETSVLSQAIPNLSFLDTLNNLLKRLESESVSRLKREFQQWVNHELQNNSDQM